MRGAWSERMRTVTMKPTTHRFGDPEFSGESAEVGDHLRTTCTPELCWQSSEKAAPALTLTLTDP